MHKRQRAVSRAKIASRKRVGEIVHFPESLSARQAQHGKFEGVKGAYLPVEIFCE